MKNIYQASMSATEAVPLLMPAFADPELMQHLSLGPQDMWDIMTNPGVLASSAALLYPQNEVVLDSPLIHGLAPDQKCPQLVKGSEITVTAQNGVLVTKAAEYFEKQVAVPGLIKWLGIKSVGRTAAELTFKVSNMATRYNRNGALQRGMLELQSTGAYRLLGLALKFGIEEDVKNERNSKLDIAVSVNDATFAGINPLRQISDRGGAVLGRYTSVPFTARSKRRNSRRAA